MTENDALARKDDVFALLYKRVFALLYKRLSQLKSLQKEKK
jgi:hypothetical protein